jgi:hypothetical protein
VYDSRIRQIGFNKPTLGGAFIGDSSVVCPLYQVLDHVGIDLSKTED